MTDSKHIPHFLITRFNLRLFDKDKHHKSVLTEEWLANRFALFERYCFPSVRNQSSQEFTWICLFDADTPDAYKSKIAEYQQSMPNFQPLYVTAEDAPRHTKIVADFIADQLQQSSFTGAVLTSRLDNDDMLHRDYIKKVQEMAEGATENAVFTFGYGLQYFTSQHYATLIRYRNNHFISLVEKTDCVQEIGTVLQYNHFFIDQCGIPVKEDCNAKGMWVEVIHDENVDNDAKMTFDFRYYALAQSQNDYGTALSDAGKCKYYKTFYFHLLQQIIRRAKNKILRK